MANKKLFALKNINEAGGLAYKMSPPHALAQLATTSCLNNTMYVSAEKQLGQILMLAQSLPAEYVAKIAVYSRELFFMKDVPALLTVVLAARKETKLLEKIFARVIDNGDMMRNFFEMMRSGITGRRSFGTVPKQLMISWFNCRTPNEIFDQSVGTPSLKDILRCIRPKPLDRERSALYAWLTDKTYDFNLLPEKVQVYEDWKIGKSKDMPKTDFRMYTNRKLDTEQWKMIAQKASWFWLMRNVNTLQRHGVFSIPGMSVYVAERLGDREAVKKARVFPYQIMTAYQSFGYEIPSEIKDGVHIAMETATRNTPYFKEPPVVFTDISGSMKYPVTGSRYGSTTVTKRVDVAALFSCCMLRNNPNTEMLFFRKELVDFKVDSDATVMQNALAISKMADGATACSAPLKYLNEVGRRSNLLVCVSDDQSWAESMNIDRLGRKQTGETAFQSEWKRYKSRNPSAKMVCLDVAPYTTTQIQEMPDVLSIGGFSDNVFRLIEQFVNGDMNSDLLVEKIEAVDLSGPNLRKVSQQDTEESFN